MSDALGPKIETVEWFVNTVMRDMVNGTDRRAWILGAGASKESDIPLAWELAQTWAREIFDLDPTEDDKLKSKLKAQGWDPNELDQHYFDIYDMRFPSPSSGYAALLEVIKDRTPSFGYFVLAHLLSTTQSNLAITVNFDNLVANAIYLAGQGYPLILDHEGVAHLANPMTDVPMICKIHRDLTKDPLNRSGEMAELDKRWFPALDGIFKFYSPIFLGYGGNDHTLMSYLSNYEHTFPGRPIWLLHTRSGEIAPSDVPNRLNDECIKFLVKNNGAIIPFSSFDVLMYLIKERRLKTIDVEGELKMRTEKIIQGLAERVEQMANILGSAPSADPLTAAIKAEPATTAFDLFVRAFAEPDPENQIRLYDQAIALDPKYVATYYNRGAAKANLRRYAEALQDFDQAIALDPKYVAAHTYRGIAKANLQRYEEAIQDYDQAIAIDPKYVAAYSNRGAAKASLQRYDEALQDYDQAIAIDPKYAAAYYNRGNAHTKLQRYEEAIQYYDQAIAIDPRYVVAYSNRGVAKANLQRYEEAIQDFDQAIAINPEDVETYSNRGVAKANLQRYEEAIQDYDQAIAIDPNHVNAIFNKACVFALQGDASNAVVMLQKAIDLDSQNREKAKTDSDFDAIRTDPSFNALVNSANADTTKE